MKHIKICNLSVKIDNKLILNNINLDFNINETTLILGPNGHGKSSLLKSIMRHYTTNIVDGEILIDDNCINDWTTDKVAKSGIYFSMQNPVDIPGLKTFDLLRNELNNNSNDKNISVLELYKNINDKLKQLELNNEILERNINENFSGGEKKKIEILQLELLDPNFILLDEIDSGLDVGAVEIIANILLKYKNKKGIIFISHNDKLLELIKPDKVILIYQGEIVQIGDISLAKDINKLGYKKVLNNLGINVQNDFDDNLNPRINGFSCNGK